MIYGMFSFVLITCFMYDCCSEFNTKEVKFHLKHKIKNTQYYFTLLFLRSAQSAYTFPPAQPMLPD
jgi:hypothetical protein